MRELILDAICKHDQDRFGVDMSGKRKINVDKTADDLLQLMCYREVSIHWVYMKNTFDEWAARDILIKQLSSDYPESMITATIERVKSEQP